MCLCMYQRLNRLRHVLREISHTCYIRPVKVVLYQKTYEYNRNLTAKNMHCASMRPEVPKIRPSLFLAATKNGSAVRYASESRRTHPPSSEVDMVPSAHINRARHASGDQSTLCKQIRFTVRLSRCRADLSHGWQYSGGSIVSSRPGSLFV